MAETSNQPKPPEPARPTGQRTPEEIRASIEHNRAELSNSLEKLKVEIVEITDWRGHIRRHKREVMVGAAVAGFVLGGGIAAVGSLMFGRRRRRKAAQAANPFAD